MRLPARKVLRVVRRKVRGATRPTSAGPVAARRAEVRRSLAASTPVVPRPRDPGTVAWVVAGGWLRSGLAWQWTQVEPAPARWRGLPDADPDLLLIEVVAGRVPGWPGEVGELEELGRELSGRGVPVLIWETGGSRAPGPEAVVRHATAVAVTDPARVELWRDVQPGVPVEVLGPAVEPRLAVPGGPAGRRLAAGALPVRTDLADGPAPELRELAGRAATDVWWAGHASTSMMGRSVPGDALGTLLGRYRVCLTDDPWVAVASGAAQTPVVWSGPPPRELADVVTSVETGDSARGVLTGRVHQAELRDREGLCLHRAVLGTMTLEARARAVLAVVGVTAPQRRSASVSAVVPTNRAHEVDNVLDNIGRQLHDPTQLVLVLHGLEVSVPDLRARARERGVTDLTVVTAEPELTLGACMNLGVAAAEGEYVAKMDDDNFYGEHFLTDLVAAFDYTDAGIAGKWAHYVWLRSSGAVVLRYPHAEHTYERRVQGGSMLFDGAVVRELGFSDIPRAVDSDILDRAIQAGVRIYSGDRFNYVSVRGTDRTGHTWPVEDSTFLTGSGSVVFYGDPRLHVSV